MVETCAYDAINFYAQIFGSRNNGCETWVQIQILFVEPVYNLTSHKAIQLAQIDDHPCYLIYFPAHRYFYGIVVAVPVGMIAFSIYRLVLLQ